MLSTEFSYKEFLNYYKDYNRVFYLKRIVILVWISGLQDAKNGLKTSFWGPQAVFSLLEPWYPYQNYLFDYIMLFSKVLDTFLSFLVIICSTDLIKC